MHKPVNKPAIYTLLVIVSSPAEQETIRNMLKDGNYNIIPAYNEQEAILKSRMTPPDMILLDIEVTALREFTTIQKLRRRAITKNIPILFFTTIENEDAISECLQYGNIDFMTKPFRQKELIVRIKHQLSLLEARRTIRRQNERLKKTIDSRDRLYSVIAHDLRAPISTIKMINATIEEERGRISDAKIRRLFGMINDTTEQAFNLLENLLRWSRNQNGRTKVLASDMDVSASTRQVVSLFKTIAKAKNIRLQNQLAESLHVYADEDMVKTILRNLISNAIKFTYPGGEVTVSARHDANCVTISVTDNGQGIKKELQTKLLKDDEHITTYGTKNEKGSGLGLLLCRDFVKLNKGKFWFESEEGKGTTFYFTLPRKAIALNHPHDLSVSPAYLRH